MKRFLITVYATVSLGCFFGKAQSVSSINFTPVASIPTAPVNISQFEVRGKLITQNSTTAIPTTLTQTGSFDPTASWNSMGNINFDAVTPNLTQTINGFRSQTKGRGLAWGYSIPAPGQPNAGVLTSPFIEWIGNSGASVSPGNLEFKYALSPTGAAAVRVPIFTMSPASGAIPSFNFAETNALVGQKQSGTFGSFGIGDTWSATGQINVPTPVNLTTYGARHQFEGYTVNSGLLKDIVQGTTSGVLDYGISVGTVNPRRTAFKFRVFSDATLPSSVKNVWQSNVGFGNMILGRQDQSAVNSSQFYLSLFDGVASAPSNTALNFVQRAGIYVVSDGKSPDGTQLNSYAAVVGDISGAAPTFLSSQAYGILGIADGNYVSGSTGNARNAGYFIGNLLYTGLLLGVSDKKFKTKINDEENILPKLMKLTPKNYYFDIEKYKNMAFDDKLQHGLISQEVEAIFPELVNQSYAPNSSKDPKEDGKPIDYKGLNYIGFIPMLLKGIQELKVENDALKIKVENLEAKNNNNTLVLNDKLNLPADIENKAFALSQNTPNPFSERTTISYTIPTTVQKATLGVFDLTGKMLLQFNLTQGKNQLTINGSTLPAGMYLYSLLADGQEVLSKKMILTK